MQGHGAPLRVVSLLPSATEMVDIVLQEDTSDRDGLKRAILVGRSHECDFPPHYEDLPMLTSSKIKFTTSADVDRQVKEELASGSGLYTVDQVLLASLKPDIIVTQSLCKVCSVDLCRVQEIAESLDTQPIIIDTNPASLDDVLQDVVRIGKALGMEEAGKNAQNRLKQRVETAVQIVKQHHSGNCAEKPVRNIAFCEWTDPIFVGGHWTPELIELAGGRHPLNPAKNGGGTGGGAGNSFEITHQAFIESDPDMVIIAPCGLDLGAARREVTALTSQSWWHTLRAVRDGKVWLVDGNQMFNRPGPRLVDCLEWLVAILHGRRDMLPPGGFPAELLCGGDMVS